jgi:hypothetical protein
MNFKQRNGDQLFKNDRCTRRHVLEGQNLQGSKTLNTRHVGVNTAPGPPDFSIDNENDLGLIVLGNDHALNAHTTDASTLLS